MVDAPGAPGLPGLGLGASRRLDHHTTLAALLNSCLERGKVRQMPCLVAFARLGQVRAYLQQSPAPQGAGASEVRSSSEALAVAQVQAACALRDVSLLHHAAALDACSGASAHRAASAGPSMAPTRGLYADPSVHAAPGCAAARADCQALKQATGCAHLLYSQAWVFAGSPSLAHLHAVVLLACYGSAVSAADSDLARAIVVQVIKDKQGIGAASEVTEAASKSDGLCGRDSKPLLVAQLSRDIDAALSGADVRQAQWLLHGIADLVSLAPDLDMAIRAQVLQHQSVISIASGRLTEALDAANQLFCLASHMGMQAEALQSLLLLARVHVAADNWATGLLYVLSCLLHASLLSHDTLAVEASTALVSIWHQLCPSATFELRHMLQELLPFVLAAGPHMLRRRALSLASALSTE